MVARHWSSSLYTRPTYLVAENETRLKNNAIKMRIFKVLCLAIKHQQHGLGSAFSGNTCTYNLSIGAQTAIVQNLQYYEHLSESMAELLQILTEQYDYPHLTDEILRYHPSHFEFPSYLGISVAKSSITTTARGQNLLLRSSLNYPNLCPDLFSSKWRFWSNFLTARYLHS